MSSESTSARALASRRNGARSRGPRTAAGKARSAQNALKHGLCAKKLLVLPEDAAEFKALEAALLDELAPVGALQAVLAQRMVSAAWRLMRADRFEAEVLEFRGYDDAGLGLALIRDGNATRGVETALRYRNAALAEFMRALKTLQALQAEARAGADRPAALPAPRRARPPASKRSELESMRQRNPSTAKPARAPRQDAPEQERRTDHAGPIPASAGTTKPTREATPQQRLDPRAPGRARSDLPAHERADIGAAPLEITKRTREKTPDQRFGLRAIG